MCLLTKRGGGINQCESYLVNSQVLVTEQCKVKLKAQERVKNLRIKKGGGGGSEMIDGKSLRDGAQIKEKSSAEG